MPPKCKFTKNEIIEAALAIVRREGMKAVTARALGDELKSSSKPVFSLFQNMEEVQQEVVREAKQIYRKYVQEGLSADLPFKGVGAQYIRFAMEEPKLFQLLFMKEQEDIPDFDGILPVIEESYETILSSIQTNYGLDLAFAKRLYQHLWIYTHGIAVLCATKMCRFTGEEISEMMTEVFTGLFKNR